MKKIYLFLLVTVLAFAGSQKAAFAGGCSTVVDTWTATSPQSSFYPFGILEGSYSGSSTLTGDLFYEGSLLIQYESFDGTIFLADLNPGSYQFIYCGGTIDFTIDPLACDIQVLNIGGNDVTGAGCAPNGSVELTVTSSTPGQPFYYDLTEIGTNMSYTGQDDGFGIISITGLPAGTYALTVSPDQDVLNSTCVYSALVMINEPACDMAITSSTITDATTIGGADGSIAVTLTGSSCIPSGPGGIPEYVVYAQFDGAFYGNLTYNALTGAYEITGLPTGVYNIIAENGGSSCFASGFYPVGEPDGCDLPRPIITGTNTTICNGSPAILSAPIGFDAYQWIYNGSFLITQALVGTDRVYWAYLEGSYSCQVTENGCTATSEPIFVSAPLSPQINFPDTIYSCTGSVTLTTPAGFTHQLWSTLDTTETVTITSNGWYGLAAGVESLVCGVVDSFYVSLNNAPPAVSINVIGSNPFCIGEFVQLQSTSDLLSHWNTGSFDQTITVINSGTYTVEVTNTIGCTNSASIDVTNISCVDQVQLANGVCGNMGYVKTSAIICQPVANATKYEWQFSNGNGVYATKSTVLNNVALHNVTPTIGWGTTWTLRVRAYVGSLIGDFSAPCTIGLIQDPAIAGVPTTKLRNEDCNKLNYRLNNNNRLVANTISGATQYEFEFSIPGGAVVATAIRSNTVLFLNTVTPALTFPQQYNVRVRAKLGSVFGPYGPVCLIGIIGENRDGGVAESAQYDDNGNLIQTERYFDLSAMPNPYTDMTSIVINSSENENVYIQFYDMTGKLVDDIKVTTNNKFNVGQDLSKGIYLLKARSESGNQITTRIIKTN